MIHRLAKLLTTPMFLYGIEQIFNNKETK